MELSGLKVLVVEDEYFIAEEISGSLKDAGAEVIGPFASYREAFAVLSSEWRPDLAILDVNLLGKVDFRLADQLVAAGIPFVFATGYGSGSIPPRFDEVAIWEKPFDTNLLVAAISSWMRLPERQSEGRLIRRQRAGER